MNIFMLLLIISPVTAFLPIIYLTKKITFNKEILFKNPMNVCLLLLFIWSAVSGIANQSWLSVVLSFAILLYLVLSVYIHQYLFDENKIVKLLRSMLWFSVAAAVAGIIEKLTFVCFHGALWKTLLGYSAAKINAHRIYSTFGNPNIAGAWFAAMIVVCLYFISNTTKVKRRYYQAAVIIFLTALCLTGSRGASIGLLAGVIFYYAFKKNRGNIVLPIVLIIFLALIIFGPAQIFNLNNVMGRDINISYDSRFSIWKGCFDMFKAKPILGWGLTGVYDHGLQYIDYYRKVYHAQNIWITLFTSFGIVGLAIYSYMKLYIFSCIRSLRKQSSSLVSMLAAIQVLIIGHGFVDCAILTPQMGILFFGCSAILSSLAVKSACAVDVNSEKKSTIKVAAEPSRSGRLVS